MRRFAVLLAGIALLVPLVAVPAGPASAATSSLSVTVIGRDGHIGSGDVTAIRLADGWHYGVRGGHTVRLPAGRYDVFTDVFTKGDQSDTLSARRITVSGATKLTIDARHGHRVRATLSPAAPNGYQHTFLMSLCDTGLILGSAGFYTVSDALYVVGSGLRGIEFAFASIWEPIDKPGAAFLATARYRGGVPSGVSRTFRQSALATIAIRARTGPQTGTVQLGLQGYSADECVEENLQLFATGRLPLAVSAHVSAGSWSVAEDGQDYLAGRARTYRSGHRYRLTLNRAAWGPGGDLPFTSAWDRRLQVNTARMFTDPELRASAGARITFTLSGAGRTILHKTGAGEGTMLDPVLPGAGWYTLVASATRRPDHTLPAGMLSTRSSLRLHFYASPASGYQVRGYLTRFSPHGLDAANRATAGSHTTVHLLPQRGKPTDGSVRQLPDSVHRVRAWASTDGGRTWHRLSVRHTASGWSAVVHNPQSGYVSLRSTVTDTHGSASTTQVIRAYAVR